ncbi:MAG TPA: hypothetical protein VMZ51_08150 [Acidimicrobiales bacterium]|nr:hypothetical protein [Acidimicrobiales bacterium]
MGRRHYKGNAVATTITATINSSDSSITIASNSGWPDGIIGAFYVVIDRGTVNEESVLIQSRTGSTLAVAASGRGSNDTIATAHNSGATIEHVFTKTDADEANDHINTTVLDHHTQYLTNARHDVTARHSVGTVVPTGSPIASVAGDTVASGSNATGARSDHRHDRAVDPQGLIASAFATTSTAGISTETQVLSVAGVNPAPGTRWVRCVAQLTIATTGAAVLNSPEVASVRIKRAGVTIARGTYYLPNTGTGVTCVLNTVDQTSSTDTYSVTVERATGSGTLTSFADGTQKSILAIEDLGQ